MNGSPPRREVIDDETVRRLVDRRSSHRMLVLVEPSRPTVRRTVRRGNARESRDTVQVSVPTGDGGDLAAAIRRITGRPPHYLVAAGAFVVEATGEQLAELAALPCVATIRASRRTLPSA